MVTVRMLLNLAVQRDMKLKLLDIKTAYLNGDIDDEIYVEQPPGFAIPQSCGCNYVSKLKLLLYGLKQSGRNWFHRLRDFLLSINFRQSNSDPCLFLREPNSPRDFVASWVDSLVYCSDDESCLEENFEKTVAKKFTISESDDLNWFLGMQIKREEGRIDISKKHTLKLYNKT